jgi:hypothetical protein
MLDAPISQLDWIVAALAIASGLASVAIGAVMAGLR